MKRMKKRTGLWLAAICLAIIFSGCGVQLDNVSSGSEDSSSQTESQMEVIPENYEDTLEGLCSYMTDAGYISGDKTDMEAQIIGASAGVKYSFSLEGENVNVEIYSFDLDQLNETGKATIESVKNDGTFLVLETKVSGILSDSGKYMMIFANEGDEAFTAAKDEIIAAFKAFKA
jgi:hypothetical protein